jgi:hypothetical protein
LAAGMRDGHKVREACKGRHRKRVFDTYRKRRTAILVHECTRFLNTVPAEWTGSWHTHIAPTAMIQCIDMASRTFVVSSLGYALRKIDDLEIVIRAGICARIKPTTSLRACTHERR